MSNFRRISILTHSFALSHSLIVRRHFFIDYKNPLSYSISKQSLQITFVMLMSSKQTDNRIQVKGTSYFTKITVKEEKSLEDRCKVIAVTNQKGGVAKTTTTVDLGVALARLGLKVCLIDSDPQSSLSKSCKVSDDPDLLDVTLSELMEYEMTGEDKDYLI